MSAYSVEEIMREAESMIDEFPGVIAVAESINNYVQNPKIKPSILELSQRILDVSRNVDQRKFLAALGVVLRAITDSSNIPDKRQGCLAVGLYAATTNVATMRVVDSNN